MQEFGENAKRSVSGLPFGFHRSKEIEPRKQNPSTIERSFSALRFASFLRSMMKDLGSLSRVQMNALWAPLTVFPDLKVTCANFSLDKADDFIDGINFTFFLLVKKC